MTVYRWNHSGLPHTGWNWLSVTDNVSATFICQMCGKESVRYIHNIEHPDAGTLCVGCVCAANLCQTDAKEHERRFKRAQRRRATFIQQFRWTENRGGDLWCRRSGFDFRIYPLSVQVFRARLDRGVKRYWLTGVYPSRDEAAAALYDRYLVIDAELRESMLNSEKGLPSHGCY